MEEAVKEQLSGKPKKKKKKKKTAGKKSSSNNNLGLAGGLEVNLDELDFNLDDVDSDSGGSTGLLDL